MKVGRIMKKVDLEKIEKVSNEFNNDIILLNKELKRVASIKCRLKKQKGKSSYQEEMENVLDYEQVLKEAKQLINPKSKFVTDFEQEDVDKLDYDETVKALKSIQSKKSNSAWLTDNYGDNDVYRKACEIESMLLDHKKQVKPVDNDHIRKTDLLTVIESIETGDKNLTKKRIVQLLKDLT